eukprot:TRINITY_DN54409_c0_g1_i1.p1 TRINITY_DN54409_c0_g1~~TRINITY_DN54409_c0_g1_i1.p1  ORF type:complete len:355 (+),score=46.17 TRINITY_DN54409_c0_g1_i1:128-1066(+)
MYESRTLKETVRPERLKEIFEEGAHTEGQGEHAKARNMTKQEFRKVLNAHPVLEGLLIGGRDFGEESGYDQEKMMKKKIERLNSVYDSSDADGNGSISLDEFIIAIVKSSKAEQTLDFLHTDWQQTRVLKTLTRLTAGYTSDGQSNQKIMKDLSRSVVELATGCAALLEEMNVTAERDKTHRELLVTPRGDHSKPPEHMDSANLLGQLQHRYGFKTRLDRVEEKLQRMQEDPPWVEDHVGGALQDVMQKVWREEVLPWLEVTLKEVKSSPGKNRSQTPLPKVTAEAAAHAPHPTLGTAVRELHHSNPLSRRT